MSGTGNNFSLMIGGVAGAQVNLTGPTTGPYAGVNGAPGIVLYQDPGTQANYGFNAEAGDAATINLTGVVYNASLTNYGTRLSDRLLGRTRRWHPLLRRRDAPDGLRGRMVFTDRRSPAGSVDAQRHRHRRRLQHRREHQHHHPRRALPGARRQQPVVHRMMHRAPTPSNTRRRDETGATLVEFALVAPLVFLLIFALIGGSYLAFQNSSLHDGATAGSTDGVDRDDHLRHPRTGPGLYCESGLPTPIEKSVSRRGATRAGEPRSAVRDELQRRPTDADPNVNGDVNITVTCGGIVRQPRPRPPCPWHSSDKGIVAPFGLTYNMTATSQDPVLSPVATAGVPPVHGTRQRRRVQAPAIGASSDVSVPTLSTAAAATARCPPPMSTSRAKNVSVRLTAKA